MAEMTQEEMACIYSAAILADDDVPVTQEKIATILKAANVEVEPIWPMLYARALFGCNVRELMTSVSSAPAVAVGGATDAGGATDDTKTDNAPAESKKEPESDSGSDEEGFGGLFD